MKEAGFIELADPGMDRVFRVATHQCVHCGAHWISEPGSGKTRGWCQRCHGPVCGPACAECVPYERQIENEEAGRHIKTPLPTSVTVPQLWTPGAK